MGLNPTYKLVVNNENVLKQLQEHKIIMQLGEESIFLSEIDAIERAKLLLKK